jgi:hypothetical protein
VTLPRERTTVTETEAALAVERAMTQGERDHFLRRFTEANPRWQGAKVADVLVSLIDSDHMLMLIEDIWERHAADVPEGSSLLRAVCYAAAYTDGTRAPESTWRVAQAWLAVVRRRNLLTG